MLWLSRRPEWQRSREFETTTSSSSPGFYGYRESESLAFEDEEAPQEEESLNGKRRARVVFQPTADTTHTIFYRGHWLRVKRGRKQNGYELLSISYVSLRSFALWTPRLLYSDVRLVGARRVSHPPAACASWPRARGNALPRCHF